MSGWNPNATFVETVIEEENGRYVLYLLVDFFEPDNDEDEKFQTVRHRIQDYPRRRAAEIAAVWIERAAKRDLPGPPTGL